MNILYTLNDKFVPQVAAGICSICENNKRERNINFYLISDGISNDNKNKLVEFGRTYNRKVIIKELGDLNKYFDFDFDTLGWNNVILARILMGKLLPKKVERLIYLDGDTIVRSSLKKLWNFNLGDNILGMSIEPTVDKKRTVDLDLVNRPYYNSGVLLVDLRKWREENCEQTIIEYYKSKQGLLFAADQDAINGALKDKIKTISPKYNFYNIFYQYNYKFLSSLCDYKYIPKKTFDEARKNPVIIHYLGEERPWRLGNKHKYRDDYNYYLSITPWKDKNYEDGWKLYFFCWNTFNFITKPIPKIRYRIINGLIPTFMKIRKHQLKKEK
ncbi:MAG: glycosyltransferase family 8 protein [Bacilli bacterium]|nr:glycosyltransferase family 8 protein [Bacilli bacterium]